MSDLFGNGYAQPFSVINTGGREWRRRKAEWLSLGLDDNVGRAPLSGHYLNADMSERTTSLFDPVVAEQCYMWFCPSGGNVLDPFCGGPTRGYVASKLGYKYTGIDIREEQVKADIETCKDLPVPPTYICADSAVMLKEMDERFDFVFSCPPYYDLEVYSTLEGDISNKPTYDEFLVSYRTIVKNLHKLLKVGCFAAFVVSDVRDEKGCYRGLVADTVNVFREVGFCLYNEIIIVEPFGSAGIRKSSCVKSKKMVRVHQHILVFVKGLEEYGRIERKISRWAKKRGKDSSMMIDFARSFST